MIRRLEAVFIEKYWLLANVVGILSFLHVTSKFWRLGCLEEGNPGDGIYIQIYILPILAGCLVINIFWLVKISTGGLKRKNWTPFLTLLSVFIAWIIVIVIASAMVPPDCTNSP